MFGLMKAKICTQPAGVREARRLAYCGVCKTLGARYGQRSRFLLSHDMVFLAELLEALEPEAAPPQSLNRALRSYNCLALPQEDGSLPMRLRFAAAATLFISEAQLADRRDDAPSRFVDSAAWFLGTPFRKASEDLEAWGVPVQALRALLVSQTGRERRAAAMAGRLPAEALLGQVVAPTAEGTGILFGAGARLAGRPDLVPRLEALGREFGKLIYLLDAYEDEAKDARLGEFNAFRTALGVTATPTPAQVEAMGVRVAEAGQNVAAHLEALPLSADRLTLFVTRLQTNLSARLGAACHGAGCSTAAKSPVVQRRRAMVRAQAVVTATLAQSTAWARVLLAPVVLVLALPLAFFFPVWVGPETKLGAAYGLLLNLMFAGQAARQLVKPFRFAAEGPEDLEGLSEGAQEVAHQAKKSGGNGCGDCCDSCDCGDCGDCCGSCDC